MRARSSVVCCGREEGGAEKRRAARWRRDSGDGEAETALLLLAPSPPTSRSSTHTHIYLPTSLLHPLRPSPSHKRARAKQQQLPQAFGTSTTPLPPLRLFLLCARHTHSRPPSSSATTMAAAADGGAAAARLRWELENQIGTAKDADLLYSCDQAEQQALQQQKPWAKDPHFFKQLRYG